MSISSLALLILFGLPFPVVKADEHVVVFEIRSIELPADVDLKSGPRKEGDVAFLQDAETKKLLETVQELRRANVMQAPKVTADPDEAVTVTLIEKQSFVTTLEAKVVRGQSVAVPKETTVETGLRLTLRGRISADRTTVAVDVKHADTRVEKVEPIAMTTFITPVFEGGSQGQPIPFTQFLQVPHLATSTIEKKGLAIPSGGHAVIAGPVTQKEIREEGRVPVLGDVPYVGRLFRTVGISKQKVRTILIVSPTVMQLPE